MFLDGRPWANLPIERSGSSSPLKPNHPKPKLRAGLSPTAHRLPTTESPLQ